MANDNVFQQLKDRLDCRDVASGLGLRVGNGIFECPDSNCPSHKRKRLTCLCSVGDTFTCQACDVKGDSVDLIQVARGVDKRAALAEAKGLAGISDNKPLPPIPKRPKPVKIIIDPDDLSQRFDALTIAETHYDTLRRDGVDYLDSLGPVYEGHDKQETLKWLGPARRYLNGRGLPSLMALPIKVGLVPWYDTGLAWRLTQEGGSELVDAAIRAGLVTRRDHGFVESFRGRVFLPWHGKDGRCVNAKGRGIFELAGACGLSLVEGEEEEKPKLAYPMHFLRTSDSNPKRPPHTIKPTHPFGWFQAHEMLTARRVKDEQIPVLICEGEIDALSALRSGIPALATGGTGGVGIQPLEHLAAEPHLYCVLFDGDDSGRSGARKLGDKLGIRWTTLPEGDLNDVLKEFGAPGVRIQVADAISRAASAEQPQVTPPSPEPPTPSGGRPEHALLRGMPRGWGLRGSMLCRVRYNADTEEEEWEETGIRNPPVIAWRGRDVLDQTVVMALAGNVVASGESVEVSLPRRMVKTSREIVPALADHGFDVDSTTASTLVRFLTDYEHAYGQELEFKLGSRQMGWHNDSFLYGRDCFGPRRLHYIGEEVRILDALATAGTMDGWRTGVLQPLERYPAALFGLYASMCAPVLSHIPDLPGFALEYAGASSAGKSTVAAAIASAFGDPRVDGGLMRPPYDTFASLELYAALLNNLPVFLEDSHLIDPPERARDLVMAWVNGQGKGRAKSTGMSRQEPRRWSTVAIITGEAAITRATNYAGVGARVLSFPPPLPRVQDEEPDQSVISDIRSMDRARVRHYGHAGRLWVQYLVDGGIESVLASFDYWLPIMQRVASPDGPQQRWAKDLALITAVAQEASKVLGGSPVEDKFLEIGIAFLKDTTPPDQAEDALDMALAWVAMDHHGGLDGDTEGPSERQHKVWFRIQDDGTVCISSTELKRRLAEEGVFLNQVRRVWFERGYLSYQDVASSAVKIRLASGTTSCIPISKERACRAIRQPDAMTTLSAAISHELH